MKFKSPKTEIRQEKRAERVLTDAVERHILIVDKTATHSVLLCM
jgi:hypothetical protein